MAESKSTYFAWAFNAHSEKTAKFGPLPINELSLYSEWPRGSQILAAVSSRQPKRIGDCLSAGWSEHRQRLETLIGAGPFLIRAIENNMGAFGKSHYYGQWNTSELGQEADAAKGTPQG